MWKITILCQKIIFFTIAEGGAKIFGVFRVKNHDFTPKNHIFSNFGGGARRVRPPPWIRPWLHQIQLKMIRLKIQKYYKTFVLKLIWQQVTFLYNLQQILQNYHNLFGPTYIYIYTPYSQSVNVFFSHSSHLGHTLLNQMHRWKLFTILSFVGFVSLEIEWP